MNGFLSKSYIIIRASNIIVCNKLKNYSFIFDEKLITRSKNDLRIESLRSLNLKFETITKLDLDLNFRHDKHIIEGTDIVSIIQDLTTINEPLGKRLLLENKIEESEIKVRINQIYREHNKINKKKRRRNKKKIRDILKYDR